MYTLEKKKVFTDRLELKDENGNSQILNITIDISPVLLQKFRALQIRLINLEKERQKDPMSTQILEAVGKVTVEIFETLLGKENVEKIDRFYDGDYTAMCADLFPYIQTSVSPSLQQVAKARKQQIKRRFR
jgi:hypothetical protein|nr:MAG TPA: hypothetical protein [Caudoviricetes sp.]